MSDDDTTKIDQIDEADESKNTVSEEGDDEEEPTAEALIADTDALLDDPEVVDDEDEDEDAEDEVQPLMVGEPAVAVAAAPPAEPEPEVKPAPAPKPPAPPPVPEVDLDALKVGDRVKCWCGKCKDFTLHKVNETVLGKKPRAICMVCSAVHYVRLKMPGSNRRATPAVNPWIKAVLGVNHEDATPYTMAGSFIQDDYLLHVHFGLGRVIERLGERKISVLFEKGQKLLVQQYHPR